jgi:hypothetical protein
MQKIAKKKIMKKKRSIDWVSAITLALHYQPCLMHSAFEWMELNARSMPYLPWHPT